jgi:Tfp pilus assembly protein PilF
MYAQLLIAANQGQAAQAELENCIKAHPEDPESYLILADQSFAAGLVTSAELLYGKAKELNTTFNENQKRKRNFAIRSEAGLAAVAEARERWDDAKKHLAAWIAIVDPPNSNPHDPAGAAAHSRLGRVLFLEDKSDDTKTGAPAAYKEFKLAAVCDPKSVSPDIALAQLFENAGNHKDAGRFIKLAVEQNLPADPDTRLATFIAAAHWALETNQTNEAKEYSDAALKVKPDSPEAKFLRGVTARLLKDSITAEKYLGDVYASSPANFSNSNQYAQVLAEQNNKEKRQKAFEIAQMNDKMFGGQNNPRQAIETAATLGWVLYNQGQINKADQVMQAIERTGSPSADSLYYRARILQQIGNTQDAAKYVAAALKVSKTFIHRIEAEEMAKALAKVNGIDVSEETPRKKTDGSDTAAPDGNKSGTEKLGTGTKTTGSK